MNKSSYESSLIDSVVSLTSSFAVISLAQMITECRIIQKQNLLDIVKSNIKQSC